MINKKQMWSDNPFDQWTEEELLCMEYQGICYGKGGGSAPPPPPATQTVRQSSEFPEELKPFVSDIFSKAQAVQEQRQEEGFRPELTQQLASFTPDQQAAFTGIREQVGQTRPLFEEATNLARSATRAATDPAEVAALMNPFLRNVTDIEKREAQRVADVQEQQLAAQAAQAGAFGGSRAAVLEAERQRNLAQQLGDIEARGRAAAFQDAQARLQNQFAREGAGAAQLSALGAAIPAQTFKELGALSGVGAAEQQQAQRALDIATQQAREEYGFPMQTLQDFQSILRGFPLPATTNVSRQTFSPAQPLATQLLGLGTGLAGLAGAAGAFKKAGGLVGAPVAMKNGGYVKLAGGGGLGQLMQGNVQRYQKGGQTQVEVLSRLSLEELQSLLNSPDSPFSPKLIQDAIDAKQAETNVAGNLATRAISEAAQTMREDFPFTIPPRVDRTPPPEMAELDVKPPIPLGFGKLLAPDAMGLRERKIQEETEGGVGAEFARIGGKDDLPMISSGTPIKDAIANAVNTVGGKLVSTLDQRINPTAYDDPVEEIVGSGPSPALDKMRPGLIQRIRSQFPYAGSVSPTLGTIPKDVAAPAAPALVSAPQMAEEIVGSGPQRMMAEEIVTSPAGPSISGLTPATGVPPLPPAAAPTSLKDSIKSFLQKDFIGGTDYRQVQQDRPSELEDPSGFFSLVRGNPRLNKFALQRAQEEFNKGLITYPPELLSIKDPKERIAALSEHRDKILTDRGQQSSKLGAVVPRLENRPRDLNPPMPFQGAVDVAKKAAEGFIPTTMMSKETDFESDPNINKALTETTAGMISPDASDIDPDPVDFNIGDALDAEQKRADAIRKEAATDPKGAPRPEPEPKPEIDPNKPVESAARRELGDYYKDAEKLLGKPPELEKGEEEDFASRKWLALAQFGTNMLRAGGDKTVFQAIGEAAQPALKELVAISKEEKKLKSDLRKERNVEKQRQYSDKIAKLGIAQKLQSADLDHTRAMADIADKKAQRIIDEKTLAERARANTALINKQIIDTATAQYALDNAKTGRTTSGQAQKAILDSIQTTRNTIIKNRQFGYRINAEEENRQIMNAARQTAALYAPTTVKEVKGKDGKIRFEKVDLTKFIPNLGATPKGGTTVVVPGSNATITMGNVSK